MRRTTSAPIFGRDERGFVPGLTRADLDGARLRV